MSTVKIRAGSRLSHWGCRIGAAGAFLTGCDRFASLLASFAMCGRAPSPSALPVFLSRFSSTLHNVCGSLAQDVHSGALISTCAKSAFGCKSQKKNLVEKGSRVDKSFPRKFVRYARVQVGRRRISTRFHRFTVNGPSTPQDRRCDTL